MEAQVANILLVEDVDVMNAQQTSKKITSLIHFLRQRGGTEGRCLLAATHRRIAGMSFAL